MNIIHIPESLINIHLLTCILCGTQPRFGTYLLRSSHKMYGSQRKNHKLLTFVQSTTLFMEIVFKLHEAENKLLCFKSHFINQSPQNENKGFPLAVNTYTSVVKYPPQAPSSLHLILCV